MHTETNDHLESKSEYVATTRSRYYVKTQLTTWARKRQWSTAYISSYPSVKCAHEIKHSGYPPSRILTIIINCRGMSFYTLHKVRELTTQSATYTNARSIEVILGGDSDTKLPVVGNEFLPVQSVSVSVRARDMGTNVVTRR